MVKSLLSGKKLGGSKWEWLIRAQRDISPDDYQIMLEELMAYIVGCIKRDGYFQSQIKSTLKSTLESLAQFFEGEEYRKEVVKDLAPVMQGMCILEGLAGRLRRGGINMEKFVDDLLQPNPDDPDEVRIYQETLSGEKELTNGGYRPVFTGFNKEEASEKAKRVMGAWEYARRWPRGGVGKVGRSAKLETFRKILSC